MPRNALALATLLAAGCSTSALSPGDGPSPADRAPADLSVADSAEPDSAEPDLAVPDLAVPDLAVPDLAVPDLATTDGATATPDSSNGADLANCGGGFLGNTDAGAAACPLGCSPQVVYVPPTDPPLHIDYCTTAPHNHNPPANGLHWPWHANWGVYQGVPQREWWIHCLEHGGIVLLYNCPPAVGDGSVPDGGLGPYPCPDAGATPAPASCPQEIAELAAFYTNHPIDELGVKRIVVAPDPLLPTRFAAVAWDWVWSSDQLDLPAIQCFIDARYGHGPEEEP